MWATIWAKCTRAGWAPRLVGVALVLGLLLQTDLFNPSANKTLANPSAGQNPIQIENSLPGDPTWDDFASVSTQDAISGYGSSISVNHGNSIDFYVTTTAASFTIDVFRTGWYGGVGARKVLAMGSFPGVHQAIPLPDPTTGMISCNWTKTTTLNIPATWVTGVYLAKLSAPNGNKSYIFFVVRNDGGTEDVLFQTSVTTYQAYNVWGGTSLYTNVTNKSIYKYDEATKESFDRPFDPNDSNGAGHYLYQEYQFVRWAESQGYNIAYTTDVDTHVNANPLTNHKAFLSVGHDEYWSKQMRDNVQNAINAGVNVAFFSANTAFWQIRFEPNAAGAPNRVEVGYKVFANYNITPGPDPMFNVDNTVVTTHFREDPVNRPENALLGVMYQDQVNQDYAYVVQNASNWVYAGTGFVEGSRVPGIVGYEYDKVWNNGLTPAGLTILSNSPVVGCCEGSGSSHANSTIYTAPSGARVFASGTIQWSWGLDNYAAPNYVNAGIKRTTANILNNFIAGAGAPAPQVSLSATSLTFGSQAVGVATAPQTITVTNSGNAPLTITSATLAGTNAADFAKGTDTCSGATVAANATCAVSLTFTPGATGARSASLSFVDNAAGSPHAVTLSGTGVAPAVSLTPGSLTFANTLVGATTAAQTVTLKNTGTAPLTVTSISLSGANPGDFAQTNACPLSPSALAVNATCAINVTFAPTASGARAATLSVADNATGSPHSTSLSGTGTTPAPAVGVSPSSLTFASQLVGTSSSAQNVTLTNTGGANLTISGVTIGGANPGDFAQTTTCPLSPATLAPNATCSISVTFAPTAGGARAASVSIADDAANSPQSVGLSGTGAVPAPAVSLSPTSAAFGSQNVGATSGTQQITLTNTGTAPLHITSAALTGVNPSDFTTSADTCSGATVAASATCAINVAFAPTAGGARAAGLTFTDDAATSPQTVALSGTGVVPAPAVSLTPATLSFGSQNTNTTSAGQTITLKNTGTAALTVTGIALTGANPGDFAQTNACPLSPSALAVNATCVITVTFTPTVAGPRAASVTITDNAPGSPHATTLSGTGVAPSSNVLFSDGFEGATLPGTWTRQQVTTGNTVSLDTTIKHNGNASLLAVQARKTNGNANVQETIPGQTTLDVRGYYYLSNPSNFGAVQLMSLYAQGNFIGWLTYNVDPGTPTMTFYNGANNHFYTCTLPTLNAWHSLEVQYVLSTTTTGSFTVWLDGVSACGATSIKTSPASGFTIDQVVVGIDSADDTAGLRVHIDDVVISKAYIGL